ncbi:hypothetical protein Nepgr_030537 [Nepenthes gracilis]|uniref:Uncharacterized protein n=1 Tax=Nepenthes gracilis TaxID=150966 RepID=A0AAD3Y657_NEPGR|nr:hypothetical protein Nepgr_030537 [Nepenthes gracilis]
MIGTPREGAHGLAIQGSSFEIPGPNKELSSAAQLIPTKGVQAHASHARQRFSRYHKTTTDTVDHRQHSTAGEPRQNTCHRFPYKKLPQRSFQIPSSTPEKGRRRVKSSKEHSRHLRVTSGLASNPNVRRKVQFPSL